MIKINHLVKTFSTKGSEVDALRDVSLLVEPGEIHGVIGMSGAGKSTLLRCVGLLEPVEPGEIMIDGQDIALLHGKALQMLKTQIGIIFQGYYLYEQKTIFKNIAFPLELQKKPKQEIQERVHELLELVGLSDKAKAYPAQLSGGQQQRVAIARAIANNPKILLCDEPTSALDLVTIQSVLGLLREINQKLGITMFIITHEMPVVKNICTKVTVLDHGTVAESGSVADVFTSPTSAITKELLRLERELF